MARCEEGYLCAVCGGDVAGISESALYLQFVAGLIDAEVLHTTPETHIRCQPVLAQFIVADGFARPEVSGQFASGQLDPEFRAARESLLTRAWLRLQELQQMQLAIHEYPLPEVRARFQQSAGS